MQNRWTSDLLQTGRIEEWTPPEGKTAGVEHYFSSAASIIEAGCSGQGFQFHFTANTDEVPLTGPKSVVFVMSEENGLLPRYAGSVGAVFKCYGTKLVSMAEWFWNHPQLVLSSLAKDAIVCKRVLTSRWRWRMAHPRRRASASTLVHHIPLGYHSLPPRVLIPWEARANDVFFAGSIRQNVVERSGILQIPNPKQIVRDDLANSLRKLAAANKWNLKLRLAPGFVPHAVAWGLAAEGTTMSDDEYMKEMANSKICLAPRGTSFETFRHYEAASAGCVVVSDRLPQTWFYQNIPFLFVKDWRKIDQILDRVLRDPSKLKRLHEETLSWWHSRLSPDALAKFVIGVLRTAAPQGSVLSAQ